MLRSIATRRAACLRPVLQSSLLARPLSTEAPAASKRLPRDPPADFTVPIHQSRKAVLKLREDVKMRIAGREVFIEGPKGCVSHVLHKDLSMEIDPETMMVHMKKRTHTAPAATNATILRNAVRGVIVGYKRKLQLIGVGYRVRKMEEKEGKGKEALELRVGFTHPVYYSGTGGCCGMRYRASDTSLLFRLQLRMASR